MSDESTEADEPTEAPRKHDPIGKLPESFFEGFKASTKHLFGETESYEKLIARSYPPLDLGLGLGAETFDIEPSPTFKVVERLEEQQALLIESNGHLREMVKIAREDAEAARLDAAAARADSAKDQRSTRHGIAAAWVGVAVAVILGVVTLIVTV